MLSVLYNSLTSQTRLPLPFTSTSALNIKAIVANTPTHPHTRIRTSGSIDLWALLPSSSRTMEPSIPTPTHSFDQSPNNGPVKKAHAKGFRGGLCRFLAHAVKFPTLLFRFGRDRTKQKSNNFATHRIGDVNSSTNPRKLRSQQTDVGFHTLKKSGQKTVRCANHTIYSDDDYRILQYQPSPGDGVYCASSEQNDLKQCDKHTDFDINAGGAESPSTADDSGYYSDDDQDINRWDGTTVAKHYGSEDIFSIPDGRQSRFGHRAENYLDDDEVFSDCEQDNVDIDGYESDSSWDPFPIPDDCLSRTGDRFEDDIESGDSFDSKVTVPNTHQSCVEDMVMQNHDVIPFSEVDSCGDIEEEVSYEDDIWCDLRDADAPICRSRPSLRRQPMLPTVQETEQEAEEITITSTSIAQVKEIVIPKRYRHRQVFPSVARAPNLETIEEDPEQEEIATLLDLPKLILLSEHDKHELSRLKQCRQEILQEARIQKAPIRNFYKIPDIISEMNIFSIIQNKIMDIEAKQIGRPRTQNISTVDITPFVGTPERRERESLEPQEFLTGEDSMLEFMQSTDSSHFDPPSALRRERRRIVRVDTQSGTKFLHPERKSFAPAPYGTIYRCPEMNVM
jgi:hypothetical protein